MYFCKMVANVTHWHASHIQTIQDIFEVTEMFSQKLPCVVLPSSNRDMAHHVILQRS